MNWRFVSLLITASTVFAVFPQSGECAGAWLRDEDASCAVWNAEPLPNESFLWSGSCEAGLAAGKGVLQWYQDGEPTERYEGLMSGGKPQGRGIVTVPSGEQYEAQSVDGVFHGEGKVSWSDGVYCKVTYVNGRVDGQAFCYHPNGDVTAHLFEGGKQIRRDREAIVADEN